MINNALFHYASFYARKGFEYDGHTYKTGEYFPHRDLGIDDLKVKSFYMAGLVMVGPHPSETKPKRKSAA